MLEKIDHPVKLLLKLVSSCTELGLRLGKKSIAALRKAYQTIPLVDHNPILDPESEVKAREGAENRVRSGSEKWR